MRPIKACDFLNRRKQKWGEVLKETDAAKWKNLAKFSMEFVWYKSFANLFLSSETRKETLKIV